MAAVRKPVLLGLRDTAVKGCPKGPSAWTSSKLGGVPVSAAAMSWRGRVEGVRAGAAWVPGV
jgi:pre-rRNA-processing protein TSR4